MFPTKGKPSQKHQRNYVGCPFLLNSYSLILTLSVTFVTCVVVFIGVIAHLFKKKFGCSLWVELNKSVKD